MKKQVSQLTRWSKIAEKGDVIYIEVNQDKDHAYMHRLASALSFRAKLKFKCRNFYALSNNFDETIPMIRIEVVGVREEKNEG